MVQWAPITGHSDSCSPLSCLHLHLVHPASVGWPVEDIVSSHGVDSPDSQQERLVHCRQFKSLTVHGGIFLPEGGVCFLCLWMTFCIQVISGHKRIMFPTASCLLFLSLSNAKFRYTSLFSWSLILSLLEFVAFSWQRRCITGSHLPRGLIKNIHLCSCSGLRNFNPSLKSILNKEQVLPQEPHPLMFPGIMHTHLSSRRAACPASELLSSA